MTKFRFIAILTVLPFMLFAQSKTKVLIVDGFNNHDWKQTTELTKRILDNSNLFDITVSTAPKDSIERLKWDPVFKNYDVIIQNTNNSNDRNVRWSTKVEKSLEKYVKNGGGLYILHAANNSFDHWLEYEKMMGMGWRPASFGYALEITEDKRINKIGPGVGKGTSHGARFDALIEKFTEHPINAGYPDSWKTADMELYNYPRGLAENVTVLSYAFDTPATKMNWPVEWIIKYGKGNVYNTSFGHIWAGQINPPNFQCVGLQTTLIRTVEWLAKGKVTYPVPANFPTKEDISLNK